MNYQVSMEERGKTLWLQDGCMGLYWGNGKHKESQTWVEQIGKPRQLGSHLGTMNELRFRACCEQNEIIAHRSDGKIIKVKPGLFTRFMLWWTGYYFLFRCARPNHR